MKKFLLWSGGILILIVAAFLWFISPALNYQYMFSNPFKVTDPGNPHFDPEKFDFNDYKSHEDLANALRVLFPVGTPRSRVDYVLVEKGNASFSRRNFMNNIIETPIHGRRIDSLIEAVPANYSITYRYPSSIKKFTWMTTAYYDSENNLLFMIAYMTIVHSDVLNIDKES